MVYLVCVYSQDKGSVPWESHASPVLPLFLVRNFGGLGQPRRFAVRGTVLRASSVSTASGHC